MKKKHQVKLFPDFMTFLDQKENISFILKDNNIIGQIGSGFDKFNEITIKLIIQSMLNFLKAKNLEFFKFLIANDGSNKFMPLLENTMVDVICCQQNKAYVFEKNTPIHEGFLKYSLDLVKDFSFAIFIKKYDNNNYALSFFSKSGEQLPNEILKNVMEIYKKINISDVTEFHDDPEELDFKKMLNEYSNYILQKNFTKNANHVLKIGILNTKLQNTFVKKILGKNDIAYTVIKKHLKENRPQKINFSIAHLSSLKNVEYILKFSYDYKKLYTYRRNFSKKLSIEYELLDISDLIVNYLSFLNSYSKTNEDFVEIKKIYSSRFVKKENIESMASRYKLEYKSNWTIDYKNIYQNTGLLYFDEDYNVFLASNKNYGYDGFVLLSILVDMFNYYKTQEMRYVNISEQNLDLSSKIDINYFAYPCDASNIIDFETKLFIQDSIAQIKFSSIEDIRTQMKGNYKYIAKFNFKDQEWLGIKYDIHQKMLIFIVQETKSTSGNLAKKIKKYMAKFTKKYALPLLNIEA
ncbi:hypothetical protein OF364_02810 [Mycoplasma enhydrae]|uniref:hypothetical protein n=1 Tax=Mycoplasma enhydrae TaxID=2499220 RepID=UPI00197C8EEC|nr:hypothetical protein [Mycoplasma enhydrae]MBN4089729.1 hypothetical protein [Mycoplasma enhydrae]MCV3733891.1 hypothetical protein [Mycoplasma enhydrae]MCV3753733.1 hypothetical protein [Mycoplasma enhydrae]